MSAGDAASQGGVLASMSARLDELGASPDKQALASAEKYVKIAAKIRQHGLAFVGHEQGRLRKLASGNVSDNKKVEIRLRLNILQSFEARIVDNKSEL